MDGWMDVLNDDEIEKLNRSVRWPCSGTVNSIHRRHKIISISGHIAEHIDSCFRSCSMVSFACSAPLAVASGNDGGGGDGGGGGNVRSFASFRLVNCASERVYDR